VAVVEATAHPLSDAVLDIDDAPWRNSRRRFLDHLLKDPGMGRTAGNLQTNSRQLCFGDICGGHEASRMASRRLLLPALLQLENLLGDTRSAGICNRNRLD
jgi:hypothetical protein